MKAPNGSSTALKASIKEDGPPLRQTFLLKNKNGMHARPCALLVKTLRPFRCHVEVEVNGEIANARSIMGLMALAAGYESKMTFSMVGEEASKAMAAVQHLFDTRFQEAYE
jgi:phosphocarrier protein